MRPMTAAGLVGASLILLAGCGKPAQKAGGETASATTSAAPAPAAAGPLTPQQLPRRQPGLWRQTMVIDGRDSGGPTMTLCVDAASEAKMSLAAQDIPGAHCETPTFNRNLDGSLTFANSCDMGAGGKVQTTGTIRGDFSSRYTVSIDSTYSGGSTEATNGQHKMSVSATRLGPCAPGQKGGDMVMANGMTVNMLDRRGGPPAGTN